MAQMLKKAKGEMSNGRICILEHTYTRNRREVATIVHTEISVSDR
jgi:hypothetical protein